MKQVEQIDLSGSTFKVIFVKINDLDESEKIEYGERRVIERDIGMHIEGEADVHHPERVFGIVTLGDVGISEHILKAKLFGFIT